MNSGKQIFRPKARIIKSLGEELISNEYVAINELVKNSYDAGATEVVIELYKEKIIISDNGKGMTLDELKKGWFEPATNMKVGHKNSLGDKGIGRFATVKLAENLNLRTKASGHNCINSDFDWAVFNKDQDSYLDEIEISWEEKSDPVLVDKGTILTLTNVQANWLDKDRIKVLQNFLRRMINPFSEVNDFKILLKVEDESIEINSSEVLNHPHYEITGTYADNKIEMTYKGIKKTENITSIVKQPSLFNCGDFNFVFRVWDRDTNIMQDLATKMGKSVSEIRADLDSATGINIYRDKFRVLPYGEPNNDWLRIDSRRVNNPTMRLSNNQIVGYINITKEHNKDLIDKVDREGLIDNDYYKEFVNIIKDHIFYEIEIKRYEERKPIREEIQQGKKGPMKDSLTLKDVKSYATSKYPQDKELASKIDKKESELIDQAKEFEKLILRYRRLSTLGQLLENVIHEVNNSFAGLSTNIGIIETYGSENEKIKAATESIRAGQKNISAFVNRLKPFAERNTGAKINLSVKAELENIIAIKKAELDAGKIKVNISANDVTISMRNIDLFTIFTNLIDNSIYWLKESNDEDKRAITIKLEQKNGKNIIIFCDNGPNVPEEHRNSIFDPYFSLKKDGTGLGLSIIGEIINEYGGEFDFIEEPGSVGAAFKITL